MDCYLGPGACRREYEKRLQPGLLSRSGFAVVDDSISPLLDKGWRAERTTRAGWTANDTDWFFFGHGNDFRAALLDFVTVAGRVPLMPRQAYGVWWSRYWAYDEAGIMEVVDGYAAHQLPLHVVVLDMDWHTETPDPGAEPPDSPLELCNGGWGGYLWNRSLFPSPTAFQDELHGRGMQLVLNTHDQCGVQPTQGPIYSQVSRDMGMDPSRNTTVECHFEDRRFTDALWTHAKGSPENAGVDFWWTDFGDLGTPAHPPAQGAANQSNFRCVADTLPSAALWSNMLHSTRAGRNGTRRGMVLTIDGGLGSHRHPQVGSGDTFFNWTTLDFQIYQTPTAANVAVAWTHDLGAYQVDDGTGGADNPANRAPRDPELFLRWLQFGAVSPSFRTHCSHCEIRPWLYPNFADLAHVYRLRSALVPYIYTAAAAAHRTGVLLVHPVYYDWPLHEEAYTYQGQYMFGPSFLVAPVAAPAESDGFARKDVWLPPGNWIDWTSAKMITAGRKGRLLTRWPVAAAQIPMFAAAGAVVPLRRPADVQAWPDPLVLSVAQAAAGANVTSEVYDDEGEGTGYLLGAFRVTRLAHTRSGDGAEALLRVEPRAAGRGHAGEPHVRSYEVVFRSARGGAGSALPSAFAIDGEDVPRLPAPPAPPGDVFEAGWWVEIEPGCGGTVERAVVAVPRKSQLKPWTLRARFDARELFV